MQKLFWCIRYGVQVPAAPGKRGFGEMWFLEVRCSFCSTEGLIEARHLHDALTQQPVPWRMVLDLERDV